MGIYDRPYYRDTSPDLSPSWDQRSAVSTIILVCAGVFLLNLIFTSRGNDIQRFLSLHSEDAGQPWMLWRTLSYGFVHSPERPMHILFNMFELWMLGRSVEERYGRDEFMRIFLVAVAVCGGIWLLLRSASGDFAMVCGASGAVCCSTMLYVLNFPRSTLMLFGVVPIQAWMLGMFLIVSNLLSQGSAGLTVTRPGNGPAVAFDIHLIGIGFALAYFYGKWNFARFSPSLQGLRNWRRRLFGPKLRTYTPDPGSNKPSSDRDEREADRIFDKIQKSGMDSLSVKEKRFLEAYSQKVRDKRRNTSS